MMTAEWVEASEVSVYYCYDTSDNVYQQLKVDAVKEKLFLKLSSLAHVDVVRVIVHVFLTEGLQKKLADVDITKIHKYREVGWMRQNAILGLLTLGVVERLGQLCKGLFSNLFQ